MEFQKSEYFQKRAHKFYPSISRGFKLLNRTHSSLSRDFCCLAISLLHRCLRQAPFLHFHLSSDARPKVSREAFLSESASFQKFPERLSSPSLHPPESFPTTPPEISRFPFGTKVIKILDLSLYLPPTRPFAVSPTLSYSPKPVLHQPRHQTESAPLVHQSPCTFYPHLTLSYNTHQSSSSLPTITKFAFPTVHPALLSFRFPKASPSDSPKPVLPISKASLSYSPKPVLHQPRHQTESTPLVHQSPCTFYPHFTLSYNNTHQSSSSLPTITKFAFPTVPSTLLSFRLGI